MSAEAAASPRTRAGWADVLLIGMDRVRELVAKEAAKLRRQQRDE